MFTGWVKCSGQNLCMCPNEDGTMLFCYFESIPFFYCTQENFVADTGQIQANSVWLATESESVSILNFLA